MGRGKAGTGRREVEEVQKGDGSVTVYINTAACFCAPSIFPLLLQGGVLGRVDFDNTGIGRLYAETCG